MASTASPLPPDAALLQLIWLASPALPVGGFSYSEGLESAVEAALVRDEASAGAWLVEQLHASLARSDLSVVGSAVEAARRGDAARLRALDDWVRQTRETSELRQQAQQMGRSMGEWQRSLGASPVGWVAEGTPACVAGNTAEALPPVGWGDAGTPAISEAQRAAVPAQTHPPDMPNAPDAGVRKAHHQPTETTRPPEYTYPVAFALAAASTQATSRQIALAFAFSWSENMVQAAVKAVPLGQAAGQRILARLAGAIPAAVDHALALPDDQRQAFTPMLAILSSQHETQYSRLFRS